MTESTPTTALNEEANLLAHPAQQCHVFCAWNMRNCSGPWLPALGCVPAQIGQELQSHFLGPEWSWKLILGAFVLSEGIQLALYRWLSLVH